MAIGVVVLSASQPFSHFLCFAFYLIVWDAGIRSHSCFFLGQSNDLTSDPRRRIFKTNSDVKVGALWKGKGRKSEFEWLD